MNKKHCKICEKPISSEEHLKNDGCCNKCYEIEDWQKKKMYLTEEVCQIAINEILEEISYCKEDADVNDCSEFIDILQKQKKKYFGIIQILKQLGWNGFCIEELETIIKASQYNAKKLNELRSNPPLELEEMEEEKPYWDNGTKNWFILLSKWESVNKLICIDSGEHKYYTRFNKGRFFRKQVEDDG